MSNRCCQQPICICKRRALVVDNDPVWRADHVKNLKNWGFEVYVAKKRGKALLEDAKKLAHDYRCHVALVDMRLLDDDDRTDHSGLELVQQLKPARSIIVTGFGNVELYRKAQNYYKAFEFVGKEEGPDQLHMLICSAIDDTCVHSLHLHPDHWLEEQVVPRLKTSRNSFIAEDEIRETLAILFPTANHIVLEQLSGSTQSPGQSSSAVRHRSIVFKATVDRNQPFFVKLAVTNWGQPGKDKIWREVNSYKTYVKDQLGGHHYADLRFHKRLWNIGGVAYSFIGNSEDTTVFATFYAKHLDPAFIIQPLQHFFQMVWHDKYQQATSLENSLFEIYDQVWDYTLSNHLEGWRQLDARRTFAGLAGEFSDPRLWVNRKKGSSKLPNLRKCIVHGDLHADNLFADKHGHCWVIDFERTGEGHILCDFVEMEQDIITRLALFDEQELPIFYELMIALVKPQTTHEPLQPTETVKRHEAAYKAFQVICGLRAIASTCCHVKDYREYYWGLLLDALFVNAKLDPKSESERWRKTLLLASIICERLDTWGTGEWPPKAWSAVQWCPPDTLPAERPLVHVVTSHSTQTKSSFTQGFGLLIGVGTTPAIGWLSLPVTVLDAQAIQKVLTDPIRCGYLPTQVQFLANKHATLNGIRSGFHLLAEQVGNHPESTVIIYFSGHGIYNQSDERYGLLPSDVQMNAYHDGLDNTTVLWSPELRTLISEVKAKRLLVLIDACHAEGATMMSKSNEESPLLTGFTKAPPPEPFLSLLREGSGRAVISSSRRNQKSYIRRDGRQSVFTHYLLEALQGANNHVGELNVRVSNLINHVGKHVPEHVKAEYKQAAIEQVPWTEQAAEDFPVALIAGGKGLSS